MKHASPPSTSARLARWLSAALIIGSVAVLAGYWGHRQLAHQRLEATALQDMEHRSMALTGAVAEQTRSVIYNLDLALLHLQHKFAHEGHLVDDDMQTVLAATPPGLVRRVVTIGANGSLTHAYPGLTEASTNLSDRPHFRAHADDPRSGLFIGHPIRSRFDGEWLIPLTRALRDEKGRFDGVVMLTVAPEYFANIYGPLVAGRDDVVALTHLDGAFLSRNLNLKDHLGKSVRADRPYVGDKAPPSGVFRSLSTHEPIDRVFAFRRLSEWPLVVIIGLGVNETMAPIRASQASDLPATVAVSLLVLALAVGVSMAMLRLARNVVRLSEAEQRLALAFSGASELGWEWDVGSRELAFFGDCRPLFGTGAGEVRIAMDDWIARIHPDDRAAVRQQTIRTLRQRGDGFEFDYRLQRADGHLRWMLVRGRTVLRSASGGVERMIGILLDVDDSKRAALGVAQMRESYARLIEHAGEGIFVVDRDGRISLFNPTAERMLGLSAGQARGALARELMADSVAGKGAQPSAACPVAATLADGQARRGVRLNYRHSDGRSIPVELSVAPTLLDHEVAGAVVVFADISERLAWEAELESLARVDTLTGVANRRHFVEQCERELHRADRDGKALSFLMIDIDHFKAINDQHGHAAGDAVLTAVAKRCTDELRLIDVFGRLGGEEFGAALPRAGLLDARAVADRLRARLAALVVPFEGKELHCTVSVGVATRHAGEGFDSVLARADKLLYAAKHAGRNCVVAEEPGPPPVNSDSVVPLRPVRSA